MLDPFKSYSDLQYAMLEGWSNSLRHAFQCWGHWVGMQEQFLQKASFHRTHVEISRGPSFTDKYGRRSHDIDPERDV